MSYSAERKRTIRKRLVIIFGSIFLVIGIMATIFWNNTSIRPVKSDGFSCVEHEAGAKYKYTISFRGKDFIVDHSEENFFNLENGNQLSTESSDYKQVKRCIKMYNLAKDGYVGTSPAQLIDGKYQLNNQEIVQPESGVKVEPEEPDSSQEDMVNAVQQISKEDVLNAAEAVANAKGGAMTKEGVEAGYGVIDTTATE